MREIMDKELKQLLQYCKDNGIKVTFTDSKVLKDYAAMNPEAAAHLGFPKIRNNEIEIDKTLPEGTQIKNLKHELIEWRLMESDLDYWPAHLIALKAENKPFDYSRPMFHAEPEQKGNFFARHFGKSKSKEKARRQNRRQMARAAREYQASLKRSR
jgi:hypothetical protein